MNTRYRLNCRHAVLALVILGGCGRGAGDGLDCPPEVQCCGPDCEASPLPDPGPLPDAGPPPLQIIGLEATIAVVDKVEGEDTAVSIAFEQGQVHAAYWRCVLFNMARCAPLPMPGSCEGLRYATGASGMFSRQMVDDSSGSGASLLMAQGALMGISASSAPEPGSVLFHAPGKGPLWVESEVATGVGAPFGRTSTGVAPDGSIRVAWVDYHHLHRAAQQSWGAWQEAPPLVLPADLVSHAVAFDRAGVPHVAFSRGEAGSLTRSPSTTLEYYPLQGKIATIAVLEALQPMGAPEIRVEQLLIDVQDRAHMLVRVEDWAAQVPHAELVYVKGVPGSWSIQPLGVYFPRPVSLDSVALALDDTGLAHVAISGTIAPAAKVPGPQEQLLLVGTNSFSGDGGWLFRELGDPDVTGAVALAAGGGQAHVGYFGATTFKVARVTLYPDP